MKFKFLLAMITGSIFSAAAAQSGIDFSRETPEFRLHKDAGKHGQNAAYIQSALRLNWNETLFPWMQYHLKQPLALPEFSSMRFTIRTATAESCPVRQLNLRLIDASGEIFQFPQPVRWDRAGIWDTEFNIKANPINAKSSWGGNADKKLDFPVKLLGFSLNFNKGTGAGSVDVNNISYLPSTGQAEETMVDTSLASSLIDFAHPEKLLIRNAEFRVSGNPAMLELDFNGPFHVDPCRYGPMGAASNAVPLPYFQQAVLSLNASVPETSPIREIIAVFIDQNNKLHRIKSAVDWNRAGDHRAEFQLQAEKTLPQPLRLGGFAFQTAPNQTGKLSLKSVTLNGRMPIRESISMELDTGSSIHVMTSAESAAVIRLTNRFAMPVEFNAAISVSDYRNEAISWRFEEKFSFQPGEVKRIKLPQMPRFGVWYVNCALTAQGSGEQTSLKRSFAWLQPAGATPEIKQPQGFILGINSHPERHPHDLDREADAIALAGGKLVRFVIPRDLNLLDRIVEVFSARGINFDLIFSYRPLKDGKPDYEATRAYFRELFTRYRGKVRYWELMNEPDIHKVPPTAADYVELAKLARKELSQADPDALLLSAGFCAFDYPGRGQFQRDVMVACRDIFDVHCFHGHAPFTSFREVTMDKLLMPLRAKYNLTLPWYANETALTSAGRSDKEQADTLFKKLIYTWSLGSIGYNWYNLRSKGDNPYSNEHHYGMFTLDFYPKAVYAAFNNAARLYAGKEFVRRLPLPNNFLAFEFKGKDELIFCAWSENFSEGTQMIKSNAKAAFLVDLMGNRRPVELNDGIAVLPLGVEPVSLLLAGATQAELLSSPVNVQDIPIILPGEKTQLKLMLRNPARKSGKLALKILTPPILEIIPSEAIFELQPGEQKEWSPVIEATPCDSKTAIIMLEYSWNGDTPTRISQEVPLALPLHPAFPDKPLYTLDDKKYLVSLYELDPVNLHMQWQGPKDLSAAVWLTATDNTLKIRVEVVDDKHHQSFEGRDLFKGDSVQLTLKSANMTFPCELDFARGNDGIDRKLIRYTPPGLEIDRETATREIHFTSERKADWTIYRIEIPFAPFGITADSLRKDGLRFNLLVNDNDGEGRKGWMQVAPGIGRGIHYPEHPLFVLKGK